MSLLDDINQHLAAIADLARQQQQAIDRLSAPPRPTPPPPRMDPNVVDIETAEQFAAHCGRQGMTLRLKGTIVLAREHQVAASLLGGTIRFPADFSGNLLRVTGDNVKLEHVTFDTTDESPAKPAMNAIKPAKVSGLRVLRCTFRHVGSACMFDEDPVQWRVADCIAPGDKSVRRYFVYFSGEDGEIARNTVANSQYETCVRGRGRRIVIAGNCLRNVKFDTGGPSDDRKEGTIAVQDSLDCVVSDNECRGDLGLGALPTSEGGSPGDIARNLLVSGNVVTGMVRLRLIDGLRFEKNTVRRHVEVHPSVANATIVHASSPIRLYDGQKWYDWAPGASVANGVAIKHQE